MLNWDDPLAKSTTQETTPPPAPAAAYEEPIAETAIELVEQQPADIKPADSQSDSIALDSTASVTEQKTKPVQQQTSWPAKVFL